MQAQASLISASDYQIVPITFQGTVTKPPIDDIRIRMPDGSTVPYTGPIPDYPFKAGDPITISFDALVPSRQAIDTGLIPQPVDGLYQFELRGGIGSNNDNIFNADSIARFGSSGLFGNISGNGKMTKPPTLVARRNMERVADWRLSMTFSIIVIPSIPILTIARLDPTRPFLASLILPLWIIMSHQIASRVL